MGIENTAIGQRKLKFKMTYVVALLLVLMTGLTYGYTVYQQNAAEEAKVPKPALAKIVKDLRGFHKKNGKFPETFEQLQDAVWKLPKPPHFGDDGHSFTMHNYYYLLAQITPHAATIWAAPINERFREGATFFVVVFTDHEDVWKGPALEPNEFASLPSNPSEFQLATMGLTKQESQGNTNRPAGAVTPTPHR
jgi:hypothetical protein